MKRLLIVIITAITLASFSQKKWKSHCGYSSPASAETAMNVALTETKKSYIIDGEPEIYGTPIDATGALEFCYRFQYH